MLEQMKPYVGKTCPSLRNTDGRNTMQKRIALYWISLILVVFASLFSFLAILGFFSAEERGLYDSINAHHENAVLSFREQCDILSAHAIALSDKASLTVESMLRGDTMQSLTNNPSLLIATESTLYATLINSLITAPCNGAFVILDATVNTSASESDSSRAGLYVRYANLNSNTAIGQDLVYYRGMADIAREKSIDLHNRWKPEFNVSLIESYDKLVTNSDGSSVSQLEWTDRVSLTDTWESAVMIVAPIIEEHGEIYGLCGFELSDLFMRLSYPVFESEFGNVVTVIAPLNDQILDISKGITGELSGTYLSKDDTLYVTNGDKVNTYEGETGTFMGTHTIVDLDLDGHPDACVATLVSKATYDAASTKSSSNMAIASLIILATSLAFAFTMSRKCAKPVSDTISAIKSGSLSDITFTGISEIDSLVAFLDGKEQTRKDESLTPEALAFLEEFAKRFATLTSTERTIAKLYGDGHEVHDVADVLFISIHTVRKHNANIYRKLNINAREELTLYIEIFRRSGKLSDLFGKEDDQ